MAPARSLSLKQLTIKLLMLLALVTGQRLQTLQALDLNMLNKVRHDWVFTFDVHLKHTRQSQKVFNVTLTPYPADRRLCVVTYLNEYVSRTTSLRGAESRLFVSYVTSQESVTRYTRSLVMHCS